LFHTTQNVKPNTKKTKEVTNMSNVWEYFSAEQQEKLTKKMEEFTSEQLKGFRQEANELIAKLRAAMEKCTPPEKPEVVRLAKRMKEVSETFIDADPEIDNAVERFHVENPDEEVHGIDLKFYRYIEKSKSYI
jgi:TRAP-type C4-dicarboxylate transport system substrate-binding protein